MPMNHRRWPEGFPSTFYVGRRMGFRRPDALERQAATMRRALLSFRYLGLKDPKLGKDAPPT